MILLSIYGITLLLAGVGGWWLVAKVACFGNEGTNSPRVQIYVTQMDKWSVYMYMHACRLIETPILRQLHFHGNSFRNMHPCLSPNNLLYRVLRCQSVKFSSSIPSPKLMKAQFPFNPFPSIALIHTSSKPLRQISLVRIIAKKGHDWIVLLRPAAWRGPPHG